MSIKNESTDSTDESTSCVNGAEGFDLESSSTLAPQTTLIEQTRYLKSKKKSRVKISSKRTFLDHSSSSEEHESSDGPRRWSVVSSLRNRDQWEITNQWEISSCSYTEPHVEVKIEDENQDHEPWGRPLTSDDLTSGEETESTSSKSSRRSSMVLKLRKVFYKETHGGRIAHYQKVTDSSSGFTEGDRKRKRKSSRHKRRHTDREFSFRSYTQNCSYLSKKRCRWVLRSAVQSAHLENIYPDLVGKRIQHLYEENDKSEVWYRGVVLRIHEPNSNPLKTVFEVKYDSEPEWQYYLELLVDYKKGWLKVED